MGNNASDVLFALHHSREAQARQCAASKEGGEGCVIKKMLRSHRSRRRRGGFPTAAAVLFSIGKPPRPRDQWMLRGILLIAQPPLLAMVQGGEYARFQFVHSFCERCRYI